FSSTDALHTGLQSPHFSPPLEDPPALSRAQFRVVAPSLHVTAVVGQDVVLRCHLSPCKDAGSWDIRWIQQRSSGFVHHYQNGIDLEQMAEYKGRTELLRDGLSDGNLDLRITAVRSSDSGSYICAVQDGDGYAEVGAELLHETLELQCV
uniref:Ig-like domain-containing protein n=1 Tax=Phasianus colchicus TaxID=9054 RepID=A0A669QQ92_PHACC